MKYAQVDIRQPVNVITDWLDGQPIYTEITCGFCIVDVQDAPYTVGEPLFWVICDDDVQPWSWYYDQISQTNKVTPSPVPKPVGTDQPVSSGAQTL